MTSAHIAPDTSLATRPLQSGSGDGDSPVDVAVPFWVTACVRLLPPKRSDGRTVSTAADKVLTAAQVLIAHRVNATAEEDTVVLTRTKLARWCGYDSAKKAGWLFEYLTSIGFLRIEQQYVRGRQGRDADVLKVFTRPPAEYEGPLTFAQLDRALTDPSYSQDLFAASPKNRRSGSRGPNGNQDPGLGAQTGTKTSKTAGQGLGAQTGTKTQGLGAQTGTKTSKTAGQGLGAQMGTFSDLIESSPRIRRGEDSIEPVPGGAAKPPATGEDEQLRQAVAELVAKLPWWDWAAKAKREWVPSLNDGKQVQDAILGAMMTAGITLDQATEIACAALREANGNPVVYLTTAFSSRLERWLRVIQPLPLSDDPLPLEPVASTPLASAASQEPARVEEPVPYRPECATCGAHEGEGPKYRRVPDEAGRMRPCECHAAARAA